MAERITAGRARMLNRARPKWVMVGLDWDGPGVLLMASDRLTRAQLDFEARQYDFRDIADLANFSPSLALTAVIDTRPAEGRKDGWVLIAAPDWIKAMQALFGEWTPDPEQRALPAPAASTADAGHAAIGAPVATVRATVIATDSDHGQD
jgi:hypothetical protein